MNKIISHSNRSQRGITFVEYMQEGHSSQALQWSLVQLIQGQA